MKFADSVKQTASLTSTTTIMLGAAATGFRTLAQAITDTAGKPEQVAVGDIVCMRVEDVADASKWEVSDYTVTGPAALTRISIKSSSAAGAAVTFGGSVSVLCTVPSSHLARLPEVRDIAFAQAIPLSVPGSSYMPPTTVASALTFTPAASAVRGALVYLRLTPTTGAPAPDFSAFKEWGGSSGYDNRAGIVNQVQFFCDGYDNWFSASQAVGAVAVAPTASAVTLARSAASGYVGSPVTITVGTDNPLTGSQTESVQLASSIAGTFSVNPVSLSAATASAASVFTPSAAGAATITGTATGTPSLTAGTIGYTANAITAPAQMAAPVAGAGINSATITLTAPSNGGSAITGYTVVSNPAGGVDAAAGTTALTRTITSLAAGTAYTFAATASNGVGTSPASPASNSVTPTAAATAPGAPTIGTAVAGDGYVDVVFTAPASNGGAAIIDYTATLSTGQTATGTTSPIRVTAPNGTAVTATVKARNSVNAGPASAASNSVTPAAAAAGATKARMNAVTLVGLTEGGTAPDYTYAGTNTGYSGTPMGGTSNLTMAGDGIVMCQIITLGGSKPMLGLHTGSALVAYANIPYNLFADTAGYKWLGGGSFVKTDVNTSIIPASGDWMRWRRVGTTYYAEVSKDNQQSWQAVFSIAGAAGTMYAQIQTDGTAVLSTVSGTGLA